MLTDDGRTTDAGVTGILLAHKCQNQSDLLIICFHQENGLQTPSCPLFRKADIQHIMNIVKTTLFLIVYRFSVLLLYPRKITFCPDPEMGGHIDRQKSKIVLHTRQVS